MKPPPPTQEEDDMANNEFTNDGFGLNFDEKVAILNHMNTKAKRNIIENLIYEL